MERWNWAPGAIHGHCCKLANMPVTTKESLEDVIGETADHVSRDSKKNSGSQPERTFYYNTISGRLKSIPYLRLGSGEFVADSARKSSLNRELVFGERAMPKAEIALKMKASCQEGPDGQE